MFKRDRFGNMEDDLIDTIRDRNRNRDWWCEYEDALVGYIRRRDDEICDDETDATIIDDDYDDDYENDYENDYEDEEVVIETNQNL